MDKLLMSMIDIYCIEKTYFMLEKDNESYAIDSFIKRLFISKNKISIWLCKTFVFIYI